MDPLAIEAASAVAGPVISGIFGKGAKKNAQAEAEAQRNAALKGSEAVTASYVKQLQDYFAGHPNPMLTPQTSTGVPVGTAGGAPSAGMPSAVPPAQSTNTLSAPAIMGAPMGSPQGFGSADGTSSPNASPYAAVLSRMTGGASPYHSGYALGYGHQGGQ